MTILILDKVDFEILSITRNKKEKIFIITTGSIYQEDKILNVYALI